MISAFGVDHGQISKADRKDPSPGRYATGAAFPVLHGSFAGKKGHKLRAVGNEAGGGLVGGIIGGRVAGVRGSAIGTLVGGAAGVDAAHRKGHLKAQKAYG